MYILYLTTVLLTGSQSTEIIEYFDSRAECLNKALNMSTNYLEYQKSVCAFAGGWFASAETKERCLLIKTIDKYTARCTYDK